MCTSSNGDKGENLNQAISYANLEICLRKYCYFLSKVKISYVEMFLFHSLLKCEMTY